MSTVVWNARGLGGRRAFLMLQHMIAELKPSILFICESKVRCKIASKWTSKWTSLLNFAGCLGVDPIGTKGGLLLYWKSNVNVVLRSYSTCHIDVNVCWESMSWRFTGCYGPYKYEERKVFWELLMKLYSLRNNENESWVIGGDFNDIMYENEKKGGIKKKSHVDNNFYYCCRSIGVNNLVTSGPKFTWTNKRKGDGNVKERLDRFMVNQAWRKIFPYAKALNCGYFGSDHRVIKLTMNHKRWIEKKEVTKMFMFENKWIMEDTFQEEARKCWEKARTKDNLPSMMKTCCELLQKWADKEVGNTGKKIKKLSREIEEFLMNEDNDDEEGTILEK